MAEISGKRDYLLDLTAIFVQKNKEFTEGVKEKKSKEYLKALHSEIQEIYNHLSLLRQLDKV